MYYLRAAYICVVSYVYVCMISMVFASVRSERERLERGREEKVGEEEGFSEKVKFLIQNQLIGGKWCDVTSQ